MRLTLVVVLCLLNAGCALLRKDKEEPAEQSTARPAKAEPVLKPSDVLKPKSLEIASPVTDRFALRVMYYSAAVSTIFQLDRNASVAGTRLSAEKDLGLDDKIDQGRMEADLRLGERNHLRFDFFKLSRFKERPLTQNITFGDFNFLQGTTFRTNLDWRVFTITQSYSFIRGDRWELGAGLGLHIIQAQAEGGQPGTLNRERDSKAAIFPTLNINTAFRVSKRWAVSARGQYFSANPEEFDGSMAEYHADLQYRWRANFSLGLGWTKLATHLQVVDPDEPLLFDLDVNGPELFFRASF